MTQRVLTMSTFAFRAVDVAGVPSRGEVEAETKAQVTEQLRERGLIVLDVSEKNDAIRLESFSTASAGSRCATWRSSRASSRP